MLSIILLQWLLLKLQLLSIATRSLIPTSWFIKAWGIISLNQFPIQYVFRGILLHDLCNITSATPCHITREVGGWVNVNGASWMPISWWWNFSLWILLFHSNGEKLEAQIRFIIYLTKLHLLLKAWRTLRRCKEPPGERIIQVSSTKLL